MSAASITPGARLPISVVVPVRNAETSVDACLSSIDANRPAETIVVDGQSADQTADRAGLHPCVIVSDGGRGVSFARNLGAESARAPYIAFVDVDIELPPNALETLLNELHERELDALQAGLESVGNGDYWSRALATQHNHGRSREWFGICATLFRREAFLMHRLDERFLSGEDIELRYRLNRSAVPTGVSRSVVVRHHFESGFRFAFNQWTSDGAGIGRVVRKHGLRAARYLALPAGGFALALVRTAWRRPTLIPYYVMYCFFNYVGMIRGLTDRSIRPHKRMR